VAKKHLKILPPYSGHNLSDAKTDGWGRGHFHPFPIGTDLIIKPIIYYTIM
jgi:hypothetical protein